MLFRSPLTLVFEKSLAACDTAKGWVLVRKSAGSLPPSSMGGWTRMYFVIGGAVAKRHVLQLYQNKAAYEDIVVRMFQGQPLTGFKYQGRAGTHASNHVASSTRVEARRRELVLRKFERVRSRRGEARRSRL